MIFFISSLGSHTLRGKCVPSNVINSVSVSLGVAICWLGRMTLGEQEVKRSRIKRPCINLKTRNLELELLARRCLKCRIKGVALNSVFANKNVTLNKKKPL